MLHGMLWINIPTLLVEIAIVSCNLKHKMVNQASGISCDRDNNDDVVRVMDDAY